VCVCVCVMIYLYWSNPVHEWYYICICNYLFGTLNNCAHWLNDLNHKITWFLSSCDSLGILFTKKYNRDTWGHSSPLLKCALETVICTCRWMDRNDLSLLRALALGLKIVVRSLYS